MSFAEIEPSVSRAYFEGSVYRNILDMIAKLEDSRRRLHSAMDPIIGAPGGPFMDQCGANLVQFPFGPRGRGPGPEANGFAHNKFKYEYWAQYVAKRKGISINPNDNTTRFRQLNPWASGNIWASPGKVNQALKDVQFYFRDIRPILRNLEWELNRVRLPMVEGLAESGTSLARYVDEMPEGFSFPGKNCDAMIDSDYSLAPGWQTRGSAFDRARIAAFKAEKYLSDMRTWLASMTETIKARSKADAEALEKIAIAAEVERMKKIREAAEAQLAQDAEAELKARAAAEAAGADADQAKKDAQDAKESEQQAADVEAAIVTGEKGTGKAAIWITAASVATVFLIS